MAALRGVVGLDSTTVAMPLSPIMTSYTFPPLPKPTRLTLDLSAVVANRRAIVERVGGGVRVAGVVKADAYGVGQDPVVTALAADGCRDFFVAHVGEAIRARGELDRGGITDARVYVLNGLLPGTESAYEANRLIPVLGSLPEIADWSAFRRARGGELPAALHVDTGMNRHGLRVDEALALAERPADAKAAGLSLVMSHLACGDERGHPLTARQLESFRAVRAAFPELPASLANSSGCHLGPDFAFDLVRPGVALYGGAVFSGEASPMRPVVRLDATILQIREVPAGESVGYGARETVSRASRLAVISLGYADGFHRLASSSDGAPGAWGTIDGVRVPFVGRISMDLSVVDVTDVPSARRGDPITLIGEGVTLQDVAERMGTIDYEVLTSLGRRYERTYVGK